MFCVIRYTFLNQEKNHYNCTILTSVAEFSYCYPEIEIIPHWQWDCITFSLAYLHLLKERMSTKGKDVITLKRPPSQNLHQQIGEVIAMSYAYGII